MYGLLGLLGYGAYRAAGSVVSAVRDSETRARTNDGVTYQKYSQPGLFDSKTDRQCYPTHVRKLSNGRFINPNDAYYKGDIREGDFVLRDSKSGKIIKNYSAEERAKKGTGER